MISIYSMWYFLPQMLIWKWGQSIARGQCCTNQCLRPSLASIWTALFSPRGHRLQPHHLLSSCHSNSTAPVDHVLTFHLNLICAGELCFLWNITPFCHQLALIHITRKVGNKQISSSVPVQYTYQLYSHPATYPRSPWSAHDTSAALRFETVGWRVHPGFHLLICSCGEKK